MTGAKVVESFMRWIECYRKNGRAHRFDDKGICHDCGAEENGATIASLLVEQRELRRRERARRN